MEGWLSVLSYLVAILVISANAFTVSLFIMLEHLKICFAKTKWLSQFCRAQGDVIKGLFISELKCF